MEDNEKPRLSRLTAIVIQLQSKRVVTSTELAKKHGVSVRTIYRDIRTLENSGIPITVEEGKGYSLMDGYQLPPVLFTEEEANAMVTAEQLVLKNKDKSFAKSYSEAMIKIKSVLKYSQKDNASLLADRVYFGGNNTYEKTSDHLMVIQMAVTSFQLMDIEYLSLDNALSKRKVEPFAMYSTNGNWLLIAFCRLRNEFRAFRIDKIQKVNILDEKFSPHDMSISDYFELYVKNKTPLT
ncbi:helix-turn-helix transcriptional regulator [Aureibacter tunicatorum]|uniref:DNA-binding transcriptional regulator YafY n=1 Tax=Aureibacter tunicatorum TaxID=866807 RepID=A0AAE4BTT8_9BACT|nr:YafY family protein [Aureibacter tunicatorum]MDR6239997.1 putative DNA-binding transcriptional regulator YafY [Aureibacter tunicatorum]BDD04469.1 transcriptional regulator [Aureibacter tunicatorum]